jgi:uncharacterized protein (TIGR03435 family)
VRRYLRELADHLADLRTEDESTALLRLGGADELAKAMTQQRQFQSWCARAPWAAFGLGPVLALAAAWAVAWLILWSGWRIFLPEAETPFVRIDGLAIPYFNAGRLIYYGAPILIGWGIGIMAARQRRKAIWPVAGMVPIALLAVTAQVRAGRTEVPGAIGHIGMRFAFGAAAQPLAVSLLHSLMVLVPMIVLMALPYLIWRARRSTVAGASLFLLLAGAASGQKPEFDVADIKPNKSEDTGATGGVIPGGQLSVRNAALKTLLGFAYYPGMQRFRDKFIVGAPGWADSDRFDIVAKAPANTPVRQCLFSNYCYPDKGLALMLRGFLEQRFKITSHQEQRPTAVYALVVTKGGPKFQRASGSGEFACRRVVGGSDDPAAKDWRTDEAGFVCANMTMANLAEFLPDMAGAYIDRPVVDLTDLKGTYDLKMAWVARALIDQGGLTVFDALEKRLGLKLEQRTAPMPFTVIDHIEKLRDDN